MISLLKKRISKKQQTNSELENIKLIAIPDIREYMIQGYKEIEQVKQEREQIEKSRNNYKQEAEKFEKLYDATLITLNEFKRRDSRNTDTIERLKNRLEEEETFREQDNKNKEDEINKLQEKIIVLDNKIRKAENTIKEETKVELVKLINKEKGNLSKKRVIEIIKST